MNQRKKRALEASVAHQAEGARLRAPSAERNAKAITDVLRDFAPETGMALEIASGTGQHVAEFARLLTGLTWQPTDIDATRLASIDSWSETAPNVRSAIHLDATTPGWSAQHGDRDLIVLVNLLHLISTAATRTLIAETAKALVPTGRFILYGPFFRDGVAVSEADASFDASLRKADPDIGYKDIGDIRQWLADAGLVEIAAVDMPANNLTLITERPAET